MEPTRGEREGRRDEEGLEKETTKRPRDKEGQRKEKREMERERYEGRRRWVWGGGGEGGSERARALVYSPRMAERQTGKRKRMGSEGGEVKLDTKSSKKN